MGEAIPCKGDKEPFALKGCPLGECKAPESWQVLMGKIWRAFFFGGGGGWGWGMYLDVVS